MNNEIGFQSSAQLPVNDKYLGKLAPKLSTTQQPQAVVGNKGEWVMFPPAMTTTSTPLSDNQLDDKILSFLAHGKFPLRSVAAMVNNLKIDRIRIEQSLVRLHKANSVRKNAYGFYGLQDGTKEKIVAREKVLEPMSAVPVVQKTPTLIAVPDVAPVVQRIPTPPIMLGEWTNDKEHIRITDTHVIFCNKITLAEIVKYETEFTNNNEVSLSMGRSDGLKDYRYPHVGNYKATYTCCGGNLTMNFADKASGTKVFVKVSTEPWGVSDILVGDWSNDVNDVVVTADQFIYYDKHNKEIAKYKLSYRGNEFRFVGESQNNYQGTYIINNQTLTLNFNDGSSHTFTRKNELLGEWTDGISYNITITDKEFSYFDLTGHLIIKYDYVLGKDKITISNESMRNKHGKMQIKHEGIYTKNGDDELTINFVAGNDASKVYKLTRKTNVASNGNSGTTNSGGALFNQGEQVMNEKNTDVVTIGHLEGCMDNAVKQMGKMITPVADGLFVVQRRLTALETTPKTTNKRNWMPFFLLMGIASILLWGAFKTFREAEFNANYSRYIEATASAVKHGDAEKAKRYGERAIAFLQSRGIVEGRTDTFLDGGPEADVKDWYNDVKAVAKNPELVTNLPDPPSGMFQSVALYPLNKESFIWLMASILTCLFSALGWVFAPRHATVK